MAHVPLILGSDAPNSSNMNDNHKDENTKTNNCSNGAEHTPCISHNADNDHNNNTFGVLTEAPRPPRCSAPSAPRPSLHSSDVWPPPGLR